MSLLRPQRFQSHCIHVCRDAGAKVGIALQPNRTSFISTATSPFCVFDPPPGTTGALRSEVYLAALAKLFALNTA
eukprot:375305-Pelagomonas_calceolata.AAC.1